MALTMPTSLLGPIFFLFFLDFPFFTYPCLAIGKKKQHAPRPLLRRFDEASPRSGSLYGVCTHGGQKEEEERGGVRLVFPPRAFRPPTGAAQVLPPPGPPSSRFLILIDVCYCPFLLTD